MMKRDMDLIRALMLKFEELPMGLGDVVILAPDGPELAVPGYDPAQIELHLSLIREVGFIDDAGAQPMFGTGFSRITWAGYDFLAHAKEPRLWEKATARAKSIGVGITLDVMKKLLTEYAEHAIKAAI